MKTRDVMAGARPSGHQPSPHPLEQGAQYSGIEFSKIRHRKNSDAHWLSENFRKLAKGQIAYSPQQGVTPWRWRHKHMPFGRAPAITRRDQSRFKNGQNDDEALVENAILAKFETKRANGSRVTQNINFAGHTGKLVSSGKTPTNGRVNWREDPPWWSSP
jgi:hypothetical protein